MFHKAVSALTLVLVLCLTGCQSGRTNVQPTTSLHADLERSIVERVPSLEKVIIGRSDSQDEKRVSISLRVGQTLSREQVLECVDMIALGLKIPAEQVCLVDRTGADHSSRLTRSEGKILRRGQHLDLTIAEEKRLNKKAWEALEAAIPGRTRLELSVVVDGWKTAPRERSRSSRGMIEPLDEDASDYPLSRKIPNIVGGKVFLTANNLSEKEMAPVKGFIQDASRLTPVEFAVDNRPWTSPVAPVAEPRVPINTGILVALLGILGALGVVRFWSRLAKR